MNQPEIELPFKEWDILPIEVYQKALDEIKEHFCDLSSEVESTTDKSIKTLIAFVTFLSGAGLYILSKETISTTSAVIAVVSVCNIYGLFSIIKARAHYLKGLNIEGMFNAEFDREEFSEGDKIRLFYYNCIEKYAIKINRLTLIVSKRNHTYNRFFGLSLILVISTCFYIGCLI
ncbi:hypothetical protein FBD94_22480 [Pedobacter hiemivivus]|uniref:SLATT domain-containing protein n=1 Tax=Pedobacter hiemivivus TaxID=2530454 RepID=A0A4U1FZF8_9SPHI|nr:hypothetical protein [Pedobacter hiemivivus]TKC56491.1 hypothetical protein FBD94_22480 [Pedobacter hiemivivus]